MHQLCFFTLNGKKISGDRLLKNGDFFPTIGLGYGGTEVETNLGHKAFLFDLKSTLDEKIEDGKDFEFEELLQIVNALEFLELFKNEKVGKNELMACDLNDLTSLGISLERAQQLHGDLTKLTKRRNNETDRRKGLLALLEHFHCQELYDYLIKTGYASYYEFSHW